ncbi:hypothetical protein J6O48_07225 [bacterium]|nr:hypothetical protein [bacterium]
MFGGFATITPEKVSDFCLRNAENMRHSDLGNYDDLSKDERERLAKLWEAAKDLPEGKYDYYFNLENKKEVFVQSVKALATRLNIKYELILRED